MSSQDKQEKTCLLIVGMHRSGTSLIASLLHEMGINFGTKLIPAANDNPKGFFEDSDIVALNKELFVEMGIGEDGITKIPHATWQSESYVEEYKSKLLTIIEAIASQSQTSFCIKDPRISLILPIYKEVLTKLGIKLCIVHVRRSSFEVAQSIHKRNNVPILHALERVEDYKRFITQFSKDIPTVVVSYNAMLRKPDFEVEIINSFLTENNITHEKILPGKLTTIIDKGLYHNSKTVHDFLVDTIQENNKLRNHLNKLSDKYKKYIEKTENSIVNSVELINKSVEGSQWWKYKVDEITELLQQSIIERKKESEEFKVRIHEININYKNELKKVKELKKRIGVFEKEVAVASAERKECDILLASVEEKNKEITHQDILLAERSQEISNLHTALTNIERSFTWKTVRAWDMLLVFLFKKDSWMLRKYRYLISKIQDFINGWLPHKTFLAVKKQVGVKVDAGDFWDTFKKKHGKIEVLFISHDLTRTGAPRIIFDVAQSFKDTKSVAMACIEKGSMYNDFAQEFGTLIVPKDLYPNLSQEEQINKVLDELQPKLVYANSQSAFQFVKQAKKRGIPTIFHIHELEIAFKFFFSKKQLQEFKTYSDIFIAVSQPVYDFMVHKLDCKPDSVVLLNAFISAERIKKLSNEIDKEYVAKELSLSFDDSKEKPVVVMTIGMFIYRKGADIFMRVAKNIIEKGYNCKFVWIGSKPFKEPFMADFAEYKEYFIFLGEKTNPYAYLQQADIFALPSREDPFPLVTLEAMALGKPPVIFKEGGGIYMAVGDSGIQVSDFDEQEFENAIIELITDTKQRNVLSKRAVLAQKKYDSLRALPEIHELILSLLDKKT